MKILFIILLLSGIAHASEVRDVSGDLLDILSSGELIINTASPVGSSGGTYNTRIIDRDGDILNINSDGTINVRFN